MRSKPGIVEEALGFLDEWSERCYEEHRALHEAKECNPDDCPFDHNIIIPHYCE